MRQRNPFRHLGTAIGFILASAVGGCGGSSMDGSSSMMSPAEPSSPSTSAPPAVMQAQQANTPVDPAIVTADNAALQGALMNPDPEVQSDGRQFAVDAFGHEFGAGCLYPNGPNVLRRDGGRFGGCAGQCQ